MSFELQIAEVKENRLLLRKEIEGSVKHLGAGVPKRVLLRDKMAELYQAGKDRVVIFGIENKYGTQMSVFKARIYASIDALCAVEKKKVVTMATGRKFKLVPRRVRKDERKKRHKTFGSAKRNAKKAERKNK